MTEVTSITKSMISPALNQKIWFYQYTKADAADYLTCTSEFTTVEGFFAAKFSTGVLDPATQASGVITFTTGTGTSYALVLGK